MTIKEVEQKLEVPRATVRFYEKEGFIRPQRGENGYREYSEDDVMNLKRIIILRKLGLSVADIKDVLDGARPMTEVVAKNILHLEEQIGELQGALRVCRRLQNESQEIDTFEVDKYWNVIEEEEQKGNRFLDIAKDVVHFEKALLFDHFGIADVNGDLMVSIPKAISAVMVVLLIAGCVKCVLEKAWSLQIFWAGMKQLLLMLLINAIIGIPVYLIAKKHPKAAKNRDMLMLKAYLVLLVLLILFVVLCNVFGG